MAAAKPRFRQTIDFISQERIDKINNFRSTAEWKALSFSKKCLILLDLLLEKSEQDTNDRAREFIKNLAFGRAQNILDVQRLADELGVPSERLAQIIVKQNGGDRKNATNKR